MPARRHAASAHETGVEYQPDSKHDPDDTENHCRSSLVVALVLELGRTPCLAAEDRNDTGGDKNESEELRN